MPEAVHCPRIASQEVLSPTDGKLKGAAVSQLQEFVQGARLFPMPPSCPVLHWCHDTRIVENKLEFRATVSFILDGVPHHIVGEWKLSKKMAQRDVAERSLGLFVGHWGDVVREGLELIKEEDSNECTISLAKSLLPSENTDPNFAIKEGRDPLADFEEYCHNFTTQPCGPPHWRYVCDDGQYQAFVDLTVFGVPHTFPGAHRDSLQAAYLDTARRVLWYFQHPLYKDDFEPDFDFAKSMAHEIPEPAVCWTKDTSLFEGGQELAERKTALMRVQNRLQQAYARSLVSGSSVWYWSYERGPKTKSKGSQPLLRATARVPLAGRVFVGAWLAGQREAQIDVCARITEFLDSEFAWTRGI
jgi:hypothetical protein